jgi:hypothetical protein
VTEAKRLRNNQLVHQRRKEPFPKAGVANGVIIGDSHATDLFNALEQNNPALFLTTLSVSVNCQPTVGPWPYERKEKLQRCRRRMERVLRSPQLKAADYVIFSARWKDWAVDRLPATLEAIRKVSAARIIVFGPTVEFRPDVPVLVFKHGRLDGIEDFVNRHKVEERLRLAERLAHLAHEHDFVYVDKISVLCPQQRCPVLVPGSGALMYTDYGHWSFDGAAYFGRLLRERVPAAAALFAAGR